jgi:hypothetical protein
MAWDTLHHRGDVLRAVTRAADERRDGVLPLDVTGVDETFGDEHTLLAALQLRWHTRLSGHIERLLLDQPTEPEAAVLEAWHAAADELPGTRLVLDHYRAEPLDPAMARATATSVAKERILMAAMAGLAGERTEDTVATGRALEETARSSHRARPALEERRGHGFLQRIRGHGAA